MVTQEAEFRVQLGDLCAGAGIAVDDAALEVCVRHFRVLWQWNRVINLVGDLSVESAARRHYGESLYLATRLGSAFSVIADFGSGGGFPGIGLAALLPESKVVLLEARQKKAAFLRESTRGVAGVSVVVGQGEDYAGPADVVSARAVNPEAVVKYAASRGIPVALLLSDADGSAWQARLSSAGWSCDVSSVPWRAEAVALVAYPKSTG